MTQQATGDGRALPKSLSNLVKKFVQQATDGSTSWVSAAEVEADLAEITQAQQNTYVGSPSIVAGITSGLTLHTGTTNFATAALLATLPSASAAAAIAFTPLRRITAVSAANLATITVVNAANATVATVNQNTAKTFDTDGTNWFPLN